VLVANAGVAKFAPVDSLPESLFDELCDIHFKGAFFTVQRALPYLCDGAAVILVSACDADKQGRVGTSIYTAAKAAFRSLARALSVELLPRRIRVNVLTPGVTDTPITTCEGGPPGVTPAQIAALITQSIPLRRRGTPEEMAQAMLFLASDVPVIASVWNLCRTADSRSPLIPNKKPKEEHSWRNSGTRYPLTQHPTRLMRPLRRRRACRSWWTADTKVDEKVGGRAGFGFGKRVSYSA
jgi:hypothetical protein